VKQQALSGSRTWQYDNNITAENHNALKNVRKCGRMSHRISC